jgi:hypothetical protein
MMGRQERDQRQLFYEFCLDEMIPTDHLLRSRSGRSARIAKGVSMFNGRCKAKIIWCGRSTLLSICPGFAASLRLIIRPWVVHRSNRN